MGKVRFVDTTIRDGQMSLWATSMTTEMMLPVVEHLDRAGFEAIEIIAAAFYKKLIRELRDDPWERLRQVAARAPHTPLRAILGRYVKAFEITPEAAGALLMERLVANGVPAARISDSSNTTAIWAARVKTARSVGLEPIINLIFTISPRHTDEYYAEKTRAAAALKVNRLCLKDPGGLLTPERMRTLVPVVLENAGGIPVELHTHCNTGLGPLCALEAIKLGIMSINTAVPPLANGSSNPSLFNVAHNARHLGFEPEIDEAALAPVVEYITALAKRMDLPPGQPLEYNQFHFVHQVPGGMISNFRHHLTQVGMADRLPEVLQEVARVRADLGYPIMVTPYSQFVGTQAVINVVLGERYKEVTDQIIQYALGFWGEGERSCIDPDVRDRIVSRPRARELAGWEPAETSLAQLRQQYGGPGISDDELLLRYFAGAEDVAAMRTARPVSSPATAADLGDLVREVGKRKGIRQFSLQTAAFSVQLG